MSGAAEAPLLSVSIVTYNQRDFIAQAIDSALEQRTDFDVEIRIGDDFSDDGTREILRDYARRFPDKVFLNLQPRRPDGFPGRINNVSTLQSCRGRYIAMLDGDDYWTDPQKLQHQVDFLEAHSEYGGHAHDCFIHDEAVGRRLEITHFHRATAAAAALDMDVTRADILDGCPFQTSSLCLRREAIAAPLPEWFDEIPAGDLAIFMFVAGIGPIRFETSPMSVYRHHPKNYARARTKRENSEALVKSCTLLHRAFPDDVTPRARAIRLFAEARVAFLSGQRMRALDRLRRALRSDPGYFRLMMRRRLRRPERPATRGAR